MVRELKNKISEIFSTIFSLIALISSFVLSVDAYKLASDPNMSLACDINAFISCGKVAETWQANLFGFPNAFLGIMTLPIVLTVSFLIMLGVSIPKWVKLGTFLGIVGGWISSLWLFSQSAFVIKIFCPWCLAVTTSMTIVFFSFLNSLLRLKSLEPGENKMIKKIYNNAVIPIVCLFVLLAMFIVVLRYVFI